MCDGTVVKRPSSFISCVPFLSAGAYGLRASSKMRMHALQLCAMCVAASSLQLLWSGGQTELNQIALLSPLQMIVQALELIYLLVVELYISFRMIWHKPFESGGMKLLKVQQKALPIGNLKFRLWVLLDGRRRN